VQKEPGREDGQSLVLVIMITSLLFLLTSAVGAMTLRSYVNVVRQEEYIKAQCAADAGIEKTIAAIAENADWLNNLLAVNDGVVTEVFPESPISDHVTYAVGVTKQTQAMGNSLIISSLGRCENEAGELLAQKTLRCTVAIYTLEDYLKGLAILPGQPTSIDMPGNIIVDGGMILKGSADLPDTVLVSGDIYASGKVTGVCGGQIYNNYAYLPAFPKLDESYYLQRASEDGHVFEHDMEFGVDGVITEYNGYYYVDGNVTISGAYQGAALIFSTGDINVVGNMETDGFGNGSVILIALGDIVINNFFVCANIIAGGSLLVQEGAALQGAACVAGLTYAPMGDGLFAIYPACGAEPVEGALMVVVEQKLWEESRPVF